MPSKAASCRCPPCVAGWRRPGVLVVLLAALFPGDSRQYGSPLGALHFVLGVGAYGLFGAAVLHGALLDAAERRMRMKRPSPPAAVRACRCCNSSG
jgi:hypothetical protein